MAAGALLDDGHGLLVGEAFLVAAAGDQRVEHVGHGHDAGGQGDVLTLEAAGVAPAVPLLVVVVGQVHGLLEVARGALGDHVHRPGDDLAAGGGVGLHDLELLVGQLAGLVEDGVGHLDLAHVVQRRGVLHVVDELVGELIQVDALLAELVHDDAGVGRGLADVVAGALVAALDHVGQHQDQAVLQLADDLVLPLHLGDELHHVLGGLDHRVVQVLDLVAGADVQRLDALQRALPGGLAVVGEAAGGQRHGVDGQYDVVLRQPDAYGQDHDEEAEEQRYDPGQELVAAGGDVAHVDVHRRVALADAVAVVDGVVDGQQPAVGLVGHHGLDGLAGQQVGQVLVKGVVEAHDRAGVLAGQVVGVRVEYHMAAVLEDAVDVAVFDVLGGVHQVLEHRLHLQVALGRLALLDVFVDAVVVDGVLHHLHHALGQLGLLVDGGGAVVDEADGRDHHGGDQRGRGHQQDDLHPQGDAPGVLGVHRLLGLGRQRGLLPPVEVEPVAQPRRQELQHQRDDHDGDGLVRQVDQHVRGELAPELAQVARGEDAVGQRGRDARAEAQAVQKPRQYRADDAADEREGEDDDGQLVDLFIVPL